MGRIPIRLSLIVLALAIAAGCGGDEGTNPGDAVVVRLTPQLTFVPQNVTIRTGQRVRWVNDDATFHTVTPRNAAQPGTMTRATRSTAGTVLEHTFNTAGTFDYFCEPHDAAGMVGRVTVTN